MSGFSWEKGSLKMSMGGPDVRDKLAYLLHRDFPLLPM
jgi:hypothetical protein